MDEWLRGTHTISGVGPREQPSVNLDDDRWKSSDDRARHSITLLLESIAQVTSTIDLDRLLVSIVDKSIELTGAERGILLLRGEVGGKLETYIARDGEGRDLRNEVRISQQTVSQVDASGKSMSAFVDENTERHEVSDSVFDLGLRAVMCTALRSGDEALGVIYVDSRAAEHAFSALDVAFFEALSRQIAIALTNARLHRDSLEKARLEQSMRIAGEIQRGLLPKRAPRIPTIDLHGWFHPFEAASGDYYDFFSISGGRLAVVVGDVSGHGVGPALVSATARASFRAYLRSLPNLGVAVGKLNHDLATDLQDDMFMSLFVAVIDPDRETLRYVNAGHPPPMLMHPSGSWQRLSATGTALGVLEEERYLASPALPLRPGHLLFACTDGILEARKTAEPAGSSGDTRLVSVVNRERLAPETTHRPAGPSGGNLEPEAVDRRPSCGRHHSVEKRAPDGSSFSLEGEMFGEQRLRQVLTTVADRPSRQIIAHVASAVEHHAGTGPQTDDRTAIAVRYVPAKNSPMVM